MEMLIKNAVVVSPADNLNEKTDILIKDGVIAKIGSGITFPKSIARPEILPTDTPLGIRKK